MLRQLWLPCGGPDAGGGSGRRLISSRFTVGGELSWARDISGEQSQRVPGGNNLFVSDHHDTVMSVTAKFNSPRDPPSTPPWWAELHVDF